MDAVVNAEMNNALGIVRLESLRPTTLWAYNSIWRTLRCEVGYRLRFTSSDSPAVYGWPWDIIGVGDWRKFVITLDSSMQRIGVGAIVLDKLNAVCSIELGLLPEWRGQGLGGSAGRLLIRKCFTDYGARRVEASSLSTNPASMHMHDWMLYESTLKGRFLIEGREVDELIYRITRAEWELAEQRLYVHAD